MTATTLATDYVTMTLSPFLASHLRSVKKKTFEKLAVSAVPVSHSPYSCCRDSVYTM